jgi:DNA-binding NarL/FixJ family response regulator
MRFLVLNADAERRDGLKTLLKQIARQAGYNDAKDWHQAQRLLAHHSFDLVTVDWQDIKRLDDLRRLCEACAPAPVAVLTDDASPELVQGLFRVGVFGVIPRTTRPHLIIRALEMVLLGGYYVPPGALDLSNAPCPSRDAHVQDLIDELPRKRSATRDLLSPRQAQILRFVHMGNTNKMIARTLGISEGTVKIHLASIFQQLGAANRAAAVAIYNGWLPPHLEVLLSSRDSAPKPALGAPCPIPLRTAIQRKYPLASSFDNATSLPMAAEPHAPFKRDS